MTRKDDKGDQPSVGETTWTNTGVTRYGRGQHKTGSFGDDTLRPSPNHGKQRLPNDDELLRPLNFLFFSNSFIPSKLYYNTGFSYATHLIITCRMAQAKLM